MNRRASSMRRGAMRRLSRHAPLPTRIHSLSIPCVNVLLYLSILLLPFLYFYRRYYWS